MFLEKIAPILPAAPGPTVPRHALTTSIRERDTIDSRRHFN